jgi:PAS domain S-box-containing protein
MKKRQIKIFLIEDNPGDVRLIQEMISEAADSVPKVECAERLDEGLKRLAKEDFDMLLLDLNLPDSQGLDTFFKAHNNIKEMPIVVLTGFEDETLGIKAVQEGAQDYLVKGQVDSKPLIRAMRYAIERKRGERRIGHLNTVLRTIRQVNQFISREKSRNRILQGVCDILFQTRGYQNAWIILMDKSWKILRSSQAGLDKDFLPLINRMRRGDMPDCVRKALSQSDVIAIEDPSSTCTECSFSVNYGDRGMMAVRLEHDKKIYGLLSVQAPRDSALDIEEQGLFKEIGGDIAFALHDIELEEQRKKAEDRLRESEAKARTLLENLPQRIFFKDLNSVYKSCNDNYAQDLGITPEEIAGKTDYDFYPKELAEKYRKDDQKVVKSGKTEDIEEEYIRKGRKLWVQTVKTPVRSQGGKTTGVLGIFWDITARRRAEQQIKASLREKEVLLQEIHHRVKNNMQIISSILNLQSRKITDNQILDIFKSSQDRIKSMALIHDRLYQTKDIARVDFVEYTRDLTNHLFSAHRTDPQTIKLNINIKDIFLDINTAIPCGLIINELVSNSLKHAFPNGKKGEIKIFMHPLNKNEVELIVSDNGVGFPKDVDFRDKKSLGLHLVALLAEDQLYGEIKIDRNRGTEFQIRLKVKK